MPACHRRVAPEAAFAHAHKTFVRGDLKQSQDESHAQCEQLKDSDPEWAWKFRILEAESALWRGMSEDTLKLLNSQTTRPTEQNAVVEMLALKVAAYAHLRNFEEADSNLEGAQQLCAKSDDATCGNVIRAQGVLAFDRGDFPAAERYFAQSLTFARAHKDKFLEATALLNIAAAMLKEERFSEAIDWSRSAYDVSTAVEARNIGLVAQENIGWAYYNLGDSERALDLFLQAKETAVKSSDVIDQVSLLTDAGYVYAKTQDYSRAKREYLQALTLSRPTRNAQHIYNALRALALLSVERGELEEARSYADEALVMAQAGKNRLDELYPLLVKGLIAARVHDEAKAERIFREVEKDRHGNASLKWRGEHALAALYEDEKRADATDREYRAALATFEGARPSLKHNDTSLPFSANAARIYDDYVHFLVAQGRTDEALRWADYSRARTLAEGLGALPKEVAAGPPRLNVRETARKAGGTLLFYWLGEKQSYLWVITARKTALFTLAPGSQIEAAVDRYRKAIGGLQDVLESSDEDGRLLYRMLITPAQSLLAKDAKVFILPDGKLNNLNFETLLVPGSKLHYWIEDVTIANASSLRLLEASVAGAPAAESKRERSLLLIGNSLPPNDKYPPLPKAQAQMDAVAQHFSRAQWKILTGAEATSQAYLDGHPESFSYIHFVAHGIASRLSPLDSAIVLSPAGAGSDSFKLYAREILRHPLQAELVTVSACYGAEGRSYSGEGLVGLSWAFLRAGAHNVVAALWEVTDASTPQLMDQFYDGIERGQRPDTALRNAKLALLRGSGFRNPFYWAPFQLYAGARSRAAEAN